jgi:site-specific recombinase XerD
MDAPSALAFSTPEASEHLKRLVLNSVDSLETKRLYSRAIGKFVDWLRNENPSSGFNRAAVHSYKAHLIESGLSSSAINSYLIPIRRLATEAADDGVLSSELAGAICRIKGVRQRGVRIGNWLTLAQAEQLLNAPDTTTLRGRRDSALLSALVALGIRRNECAMLSLEHIQKRDNRWIVVDLIGKGKRVRSVAMPMWTKQAIDVWTQAAGFNSGRVFRPVNRGDNLAGDVMTAQSIFEIVKRYTAEIGLPNIAPHDLRRTFAKLAHKGHSPIEQIQLSLGHFSSAVTAKYLGIEQNLEDAPCDRLGLRR